jgi:hypothetical protein
MSTPLKEIPWPAAPDGTTHYAPESEDFQYAESWYRFENGEWYCVNTYNAWRVVNRGLEAWCHRGKTLKRPMTDLVERVTSVEKTS